MSRIRFAIFFCITLLFSPCVLAETVNINTADAKTLASSLIGIGPKKAQAIVDYRKQNGNFKTINDLQKVRGIGPAMVKKNEAKMTISGASKGPEKSAKKAPSSVEKKSDKKVKINKKHQEIKKNKTKRKEARKEKRKKDVTSKPAK